MCYGVYVYLYMCENVGTCECVKDPSSSQGSST